tara:strand:- start:2544 stop:2852 length:309 start_codon:yes stop_codon:yes gene_type:complete
MSIKDVVTIKMTEYETTQLQQAVANFSSQLTRVPFLDGNLVEGVALTTSALEVPHGLGRTPLGYFIVKASAGVTVFDTDSTTPSVTIKLTGSATSTVSLWVF